MESLAYLHVALAYESLDAAQPVFTLNIPKFFNGLNWKKFSSQVALSLLSIATALAIVSMVNVALAQILSRILRFGDQGNDVILVQERLRQLGYTDVQLTGLFDIPTRDALRNFKLANRDRLAVNDVIDEQTAIILFEGTTSPVTPPNVVLPPPLLVTPTPPPLSFISNSGSTLRQGDSGQAVIDLQRSLRDAGYYYGTIDGDFGPQTEEAVIRFQQARGLEPDGIYGANTRTALQSLVAGQIRSVPSNALATQYRTLQQGDRGTEVFDLQTRLSDASRVYNNPNFDPGEIDGIFGSRTAEAVRQYQLAFGLTPADGIARSNTIASLRGEGTITNNRSSSNRYVVVVPRHNNDTLFRVRQIVNNAFLTRDRRGGYVQAGVFTNRASAESQSYLLRANGLDARVVYMRPYL